MSPLVRPDLARMRPVGQNPRDFTRCEGRGGTDLCRNWPTFVVTADVPPGGELRLCGTHVKPWQAGAGPEAGYTIAIFDPLKEPRLTPDVNAHGDLKDTADPRAQEAWARDDLYPNGGRPICETCKKRPVYMAGQCGECWAAANKGAAAQAADRVESRLRAFVDAGYRPRLMTHAFAYDPERGAPWMTLIGDVDPDYPERGPRMNTLGWQLRAISIWGDRPYIAGDTCATIDEALESGERELAKYGGERT